MKKFNIIVLVFLISVVGLPVSSSALPISGQGVYGSFAGSVQYYGNQTAAKLSISLTNTSSSVSMVGLYFSNPAIEYWSFSSSDSLAGEGSGGDIKVPLGLRKEVNLYFYLKGDNLDAINAEILTKNFAVYFSDNRVGESVSVSVTEPSVLLLLGIGLIGVGITARRKH